MSSTHDIGPNEIIGVVQVTRPSLIFYPPTLNFFFQILKLKKIYQKRMYQNAHLNEKLSSMHSFFSIGNRGTLLYQL